MQAFPQEETTTEEAALVASRAKPLIPLAARVLQITGGWGTDSFHHLLESL